ncbi:hypothetical protein [Mucilaginibacter polytrichastri]|uniref:Uncharacterized protein n=1 Tax=Mucilaginibacter polytrichastri TaxID=1302689 RepID=A0A1Q5ZTG3_9SPHI|nr:hypothetical protein [Mucilaginibacter polytrichastri]OKS84968.1 hypothetical protein RG47T_0406 [Mucilaginibacter polytrichastri]SFS46894.1 hypothetical protein SAMN04487890_101670 [Mucilaginibacter polytrichastri]
MSKVSKYYIPKAHIKWLYIVILMLTLVNISGLAVHAGTRLSVQQTTLSLNKPKAIKKSISYKRASSHAEVKQASDVFLLLFDVDLSDLHSQQCNLQISCSKSCANALKSVLFYQSKTLPQTNGDEPAILFRILSSILSLTR